MAQCSKQVYPRGPGFHLLDSCRRTATVERNGKPYCKQHDPEIVLARRRERDKERDQKWEAREKGIAEDQAKQADLACRAALCEELATICKKLRDFVEMFGTRRHFAEHPEDCAHCILLRESEDVLKKNEGHR